MNSATEITRAERNIKVYGGFRFFFSMLIIGPILVPFMLYKGLSYSQIMLLQSISAIAVFFFEIPTGAVADKLSRRLSLMLSGLFAIGGLLFYIIFDSFLLFAAAELMFGIGLTFSSGADSAILYESLDRLNRTRDYQKIEGHTASLIFIGQAVGSVISSFLYTRSPYLPFWISMGNLVIAAFLSLGFFDPSRQKSEHTYMLHVLKSCSIAIKTPRIFWTVLFAAFMGFLTRVSYWLYQPFFQQVHIDVKWFGLIFFGFNMVAAFSSKVLVKRYYDHRPRHVMLWLAGLMAISFALPALIVMPAAIVILALQQIVRGLYRPTLRFYINHQIKDAYRATVISLVSLAASLGFALLSPLVGVLLDGRGTVPAYCVMAAFSIGGVGFFILLRRMQKVKKLRSEMQSEID